MDYMMFIVTAAAGGERAGCLVGFATQASIDPPRFLVGISARNRTHRVAARADTLVVHLVGEGDVELAELFGGQTGDDVDKFARVEWAPGPGGAPVIAALENWFAGRVLERVALGDHTGHLLEPIAGAAGRGDRPLTFHRARAIEPGHAP